MEEYRKKKIEDDFEALSDSYHRNEKSTTGVEDVLQFLLDNFRSNPEKVWWWSYEFVGQHNSKGGFLSHRAPARASDLALHESDLVEDRKIGRLKVYRLREENMDKIIERLK